MYARIATYHGADAAGIDRMLADDQAKLESQFDSPPPGLEGAHEVMVLVDRENGRGLGIWLFETEEAMRQGDAVLDRTSMSQGGGVRTGVEFYEVAMRRARS